MDGQRFDRWTRMLASAPSRRGLLRGLVGTAVTALIAAEVEETEAAGSCQICGKNGKCTPKKDGAPCGGCGVCSGGQCIAKPSRCGSCKTCNPLSLRCDPLPDDTACGECGQCTGGRCRANRDKCPHCASCKATGGGTYACRSRCTNGQHCCPDNTCVAANACCTDADCAECEECDDGACKPSRVKNRDDCGGSACKACDNGQCLPKPDQTFCPPDGVCCGGTCRDHAVCCSDDDCPECSTCVNGTCDQSSRYGQPCGSSGCQFCQDGFCTTKPDSTSCTTGHGTCCGGGCCPDLNAICCDGKCCTGQCVFGCCVGGSSAAAAEADLCCPFGPPCGEGNAAHCCDEGETCCGDTCCLGPCDESGMACCPVARSCDDVCCDPDLICTLDGCLCANGSPRCPATGNCCSGPFEECSSSGCCDIRVGEPCCIDVAPDGTCNGPCCTSETEHCCFTDVEAPDGGFVRDDVWCCPQGLDCNKHGCCPPDFPRFNFRPDDPETYCCPADGNKPDMSDCITTVLPGRRS